MPSDQRIDVRYRTEAASPKRCSNSINEREKLHITYAIKLIRLPT
jgi:hypothetical protein